MAFVHFTPHLRMHVDVRDGEFAGSTVAEVLNSAFEVMPTARGYVLDDHGAVRKHVVIFLNSTLIQDRTRQSDAVNASDRIDVLQALSGG